MFLLSSVFLLDIHFCLNVSSSSWNLTESSESCSMLESCLSEGSSAFQMFWIKNSSCGCQFCFIATSSVRHQTVWKCYLSIATAWTLRVVCVCSQAFFALLSLPNNTAQLFPPPWHLCPHLLSASPAAPPSSHIKRKHTIIQLRRAGQHGQRPLLILLTRISISDGEQRHWISASQLHTQ